MYDTTDMEWDILLIAADSNGCITGMDCTNYYESPTKSLETPYYIPFVLYPNPAQAYCMVLLSEPSLENTIITLYNTQGKKIHQQVFDSDLFDLKLQFPTLPKGNYMVEVKNKKEVVGVRKLVVE